MARYNTPIWQDKSVLTNAHVYILKDGQWVDTGRHFTALPGQTVPNYLINRIAEDYVKSKAPTFNIMSLYSAYTETQPDAYQVFKTDYNNTEYGMYNDWSYEIRTDTGHCQNAPVNRHADARQILTYGRWGVSGGSITVKELLMPVIKATPNMLNLGAEQTYGQTIIIESNKVGELFLPAWLHANETAITVGTNAIYVYPDENTGWEDREANIIVKCDGYEEDYDYIPVVYISQAGIVPYFYVSPVEKSISWESGMTYFLVNTNVSYSAATSQSWVSYSGSTPATPHNYNTFFNVSANTGDNREAVITFTYQVSSGETATTSVVLRQAHIPIITVSDDYVTMLSILSSSITINSEAAWTGVSSESWATITPSSGTIGETEVTITCSELSVVEPRMCTITFTNSAGVSVSATLMQEAYDLQSNYIYKATDGQTIDLIAIWGSTRQPSSEAIGNGYYKVTFGFGGNKPDTFDGWPSKLSDIYIPDGVREIRPQVFKDKTNLKFAYIGAKTLLSEAFLRCTGLEKIIISNETLSIGSYAFSGCTSLSSLVIPDNVTSLGNYAFSGCTGLNSVSIGTGLTGISEYAFSHCTGLTTISMSTGVTAIGQYAFSHCNSLVSFVVPDGVQELTYGVFSYCENLTSVTIGSGITYIAGNTSPFYGIKKPIEITYKGTVSMFNDIRKGSNWRYPFVKTVHCIDGNIEYWTASIDFYNNYTGERLGSDPWTIPSGTDWGGATVVNKIAGIITFQGYPTQIPNVFSGFTGSSSGIYVVLPECVETIKASAFRGTTKIKKVSLPSTLSSIENAAFMGCTALNNITYNGTMSQWANVSKGYGWHENAPATVVHCTDGDVSL